jgi:ubiquinone biosynthesis protein
MGKSLVMITGVVLELDPNLNLVELLRPRILQMLRLRFGPSRVLKAAGMTGWHLINIVKNAPRQLRNMLRRMSRGEWQVNIRHQNLEYLASELDRSSNRLSFAIVIAGIVVGSSMIISSPLEQETILGVPLPVLGLAGYVFAGILGIALVWAIWRSGRMS